MTVFNIDGINYSRFRDVPGAVYTRSGVAYQQNAAGVWTPFDDDVPPISSGVGVDVWEARTNSIRNPTGLGAVVGSPGTPPTNWAAGAAPGITRTLVGFGTDPATGLPYVDYRFSGTPTTLAGSTISLETMTGVAATVGQTWTAKVHLALLGGSVSNLNIQLLVSQLSSAPAYLSDLTAQGTIHALLTGSLKPFGGAILTAAASTAYLQPYIHIPPIATGTPIDITLRIAAPNLKLGQDINDPPILQTNNAAATRGAASAYLNAPGLIVPALGVTVVAEVGWPRYTNVSAVFVEPWNAGGGSPAGFTLSADSGGNRPRIVLRQGSGRFDTGSNANVVAAGATVKFGLSFNAVGGVASSQGQSVNSSFTPSQSDYAGEPIYFGSRAGTGNFANTNIRKVQFLQGLRTQAELNALTA